ncbi:hypothetical protein EBZ37_13645, partial [bacterium]|nr:hypothetical protein [bacterium]
LAKVGKTNNVLQRERQLSCGSVTPYRTVALFLDQGDLEKYAHRSMEAMGRRVANEVFRISLTELKEVVKSARKEYLRDQTLAALMTSQEDEQPTSKRRRIEDQQLEESRMSLEERQITLDERKTALEHAKATNSLKLREQEAELEERRATNSLKLREQEAELEERRATNSLKLREQEAMSTIRIREHEMEMQERAARLAMEQAKATMELREREARLKSP